MMDEKKRVCGRRDCTECQREAHECRCGLRDKRAQQEQNR